MASDSVPVWLTERGVTRREAEVLESVAKRFGNAEIADALGISKRTVESHMAQLLRKLDAPDRRSLVRIASGSEFPRYSPEPVNPRGAVVAASRQARARAAVLRDGALQRRALSIRHVEASRLVIARASALAFAGPRS